MMKTLSMEEHFASDTCMCTSSAQSDAAVKPHTSNPNRMLWRFFQRNPRTSFIISLTTATIYWFAFNKCLLDRLLHVQNCPVKVTPNIRSPQGPSLFTWRIFDQLFAVNFLCSVLRSSGLLYMYYEYNNMQYNGSLCVPRIKLRTARKRTLSIHPMPCLSALVQ